MPLQLHDESYERRLRPVYDALDARSWKQAAKLADAALKKFKGDQLVRALKGYALHRSGKPEEALQLMRDIVAEGPGAERVVMTMAYTYKAAGQPEGITQAYAAAAEKLPRDPEVLAGLFRSYVRDFNFVKQQQVAMKLSKLAPAGSPEAAACAWWMVCSLVLQARAALLAQDDRGTPLTAAAADSGSSAGIAPAAGGLAPEKLLQLAETMAARQVAATGAARPSAGSASGKPALRLSYEALLLYLDILQGQGKAAAALAALEGLAGAAVPLAADRLQLRAAALVRAGDLPAAAACYREAVASCPDDWLSWQLYLDCVLPGSGDGSGGAPGTSGSTGGSRFPVGVVGGLADVWDRRQAAEAAAAGGASSAPGASAEAALEEAMCHLSDAVAANDSWARQLAATGLRAPHLWRCEALLRRHRLAVAAGGGSAAAALQDELAAAIGSAFASLCGNFSCVADLRPYLAVLAGPAAQQLAARAHELAAEANAADQAAAAASSSSTEGGSGADPAAAENGGEAGNGAANGGGGAAGGKGSARGVSAEVRRLQRLVSAHQLEAELGLPALASPADAEAHAARLLALYEGHMHLSAGLDEKERGHGEELVALAVEALLRGAALEGGQTLRERQERRIVRMLQALLVLEAAQQRRKVSAPLRLAATALYSLLGAPGLVAAQLAALDIKSILHDSMTDHWLLPLLSGLLPLVAATPAEGEPDLRKWVEGCCALHELHQQEAGETLGTALQHGTYSKASQGGCFVDFKERLQHSHARALAAVLQSLLPPRATATAGSAQPAGAPLQSLFPSGTAKGLREALRHARALLVAAAAGSPGPALRFNEDLATRPSWYPPGSASSEAVTDWWQQADAAQQAQQQPAGYAHCWWAATLAAESSTPEAAAWRSRCLAELKARVAWALAASAPLDSAEDAAALAEQLRPLVTAGGDEAAPVGGCPVLQAAACRAVLGLLQQLAGSEAGEGGPGLQAASELASACSAAGKRVAAELAAAQALPLLPGSAITAAAALVADCSSISAVLQRLKKLAGKGKPEVAAAAREAAGAADVAAAEVKAAAAAALAARDQQQCAEAAAQLVRLEGGEEAGARLWGFEPSLEARGVLAALVRAQAAVLASLK
ncbi:hypothetical protein ABPG75_005178 [Micractinium tetrahymenae]